MSDPIRVTADSKLIKLFADQIQNKRIDSKDLEQANTICRKLAQDGDIRQIGETVAYTMNELTQQSMNFLDVFADVRTCDYGQKIAFNMPTGGVKAVIQAKGSTTPRSMVGMRQIFLDTTEVSARPAINIMDLRAGRINMADLIRQANDQMNLARMGVVEKALQNAIGGGAFQTPFYGTATGVDTTILDRMIEYLKRLGPVTILGDIAAVSQLVGVQGMVGANGTGTVVYSDSMIDEFANNGIIGRYKGCNVVAMPNAYEDGETTPILKTNWLYLINSNLSKDLRNLKVVLEGKVEAFPAQNINDLVYEVRLDQWFGAGFVVNRIPNIAAYKIN